MAALQERFGFDIDFDNDGLPEDAMLRLIVEAACDEPIEAKIVRAELPAATNAAFAANLGIIQSDPMAAQLTDVDAATAALVLAGVAPRDQILQALAGAQMVLQNADDLQVVTCNGTCQGELEPILNTEQYTGGADLDDDGAANAEEFANVEDRGGSLAEFLEAAQDDSTDGTITGTGCPMSASANGKSTPWNADTLLMGVIALVLITSRQAKRQRA